MNICSRKFLLLACLIVAGASGCRRNIVRSAPPSVATPPRTEPLPQPTVVTPPADVQPEAPPNLPAAAAPLPTVQPAPSRPRAPAETETPKPKPEPEVASSPQISPQLSPQDQADAVRHTTDDIRVAERNLQLASGKQLNASQSDLVEKIRGFLGQAHEAIRASDWVRARNLAQKAQVLSAELMKSL